MINCRERESFQVMAASNPSSLETETKLKPRPLMLKDFLRDDPNSWSNDFSSFPRRSYTTVRKLLEIDLNSSGDTIAERRLCRSRLRAMATISAFQKASEAVINAVKHFPFSSARSPPKQGILPRSLSRTLRRKFQKKKEKEKHEIRARASVREIIRWKSFQEAEMDRTQRLPCSISSSSDISWEESNFTAEFLPEKRGASVGEDSVETANCHEEAEAKQWKGEESIGELVCPYEEKEQLSPISVLDVPYEDEEMETPSSSFEESIANMERTKEHLLQKIRRFECLAQMDPVDLEKRIAQTELEEEADETTHSRVVDKARKLLELFKASSGENHMKKSDNLLMDFFREGLAASERSILIMQADVEADGIEEELLRAASDWRNGYVRLEWGLEDDREACVKEMERNERWRSFKEEKEELTMEMEIGVVGSLVEELLQDILD